MSNFTFTIDILMENFLRMHRAYFDQFSVDTSRVEVVSVDQNGYRVDFVSPEVQILWNEWQACATVLLSSVDILLDHVKSKL